MSSIEIGSFVLFIVNSSSTKLAKMLSEHPRLLLAAFSQERPFCNQEVEASVCSKYILISWFEDMHGSLKVNIWLCPFWQDLQKVPCTTKGICFSLRGKTISLGIWLLALETSLKSVSLFKVLLCLMSDKFETSCTIPSGDTQEA